MLNKHMHDMYRYMQTHTHIYETRQHEDTHIRTYTHTHTQAHILHIPVMHRVAETNLASIGCWNAHVCVMYVSVCVRTSEVATHAETDVCGFVSVVRVY